MKSKSSFFCTSCGHETPKWTGRCQGCGQWNTMAEALAEKGGGKGGPGGALGDISLPKTLADLDSVEELRFSTGLGELDRVLGGGAVRGSITLVGGAPGIGKSTLLLQICGMIKNGYKILYVTGEESQKQLKMRARRLGVSNDRLYVLAETDIDDILLSIEGLGPEVVIIDSIQTLYNSEITASPGSVSQVKDCTMTLMRHAKAHGLTAFVVGHINKEGAIAGPKVLEHMVDCVLYFEGEKHMSYRMLRAAKNRFGSTNEIGVFEMVDKGLAEVPNPSEMLLSGRPKDSPGTCVTCVMEGTRPVLAEIQALITPSSYNVARRNTNGFDYNRAMLLLAVLERRGGMAIGGMDAYINVIGGLQLEEPAADLALILSVASSHLDRPLGNDVAAFGEVGLTGEIRSVSAVSQRISEISRLGFGRCVIPARIKENLGAYDGLEIISVGTVREAIQAVLA